MNLIQKYGKKKVCIISSILAVACIIVGITTWYVMEENYKQKVLDSIDVTFVEEAILEYGTELDFNTFIEERKGEPEVTLPTVEINTKELGKTEVTYILSKDGYSKNSTLEIEVKDTQAPMITLKEDSVTLEYESEYDINSNIESVIDPVDGDIPFAESAGENTYYTVEGTIDTSTAGEYTITIKAVDKNNLASEKTFTVNVNEKKEVKAPVQPQSGGNKAPVSNNGAGSSNSGASSGSTVEEPHYRTDISNTYAAQINAYREQNGYVALPISGEAQAEANSRAMQLVSNYSHNESSGYTENIGMGDISYDFYVGWTNSPVHNSTILDDWYSSFAVSVVEYNGKWYAVTSFKITY